MTTPISAFGARVAASSGQDRPLKNVLFSFGMQKWTESFPITTGICTRNALSVSRCIALGTKHTKRAAPPKTHRASSRPVATAEPMQHERDGSINPR